MYLLMALAIGDDHIRAPYKLFVRLRDLEVLTLIHGAFHSLWSSDVIWRCTTESVITGSGNDWPPIRRPTITRTNDDYL